MRKQLQAFLDGHLPHVQRAIQWIHHPVQHWIYGVFPDGGRVYHCYDEYTCTGDGVFQPDRWRKEERLILESDVTFVTSESLKQRRDKVAQRLGVIPNGIPEFFFKSPSADPDPIDQIPHPRIGYLGNVFSLLDYAMLHEICVRRPEWQMIFVGPIQKESLVRALRELPNAHFVGRRPHERLPSILSRFDIGLMPFLVNDFTNPLTPLKLFEYMGAGVPVVSTDLPNLQEFRKLIRLVPNTADAFESAIDETLAADREVLAANLRSAARSHTWTRINREHVIPVLKEAFGI
jgi:glycosyltransferase involved in cell wall biosynthesis